MKKRLQFLTLVIVFIIAIVGCNQRISADETKAAPSIESRSQIAEKEDFFEKNLNETHEQAEPQKDSYFMENCKKYPLPPDCSFIHEEERRQFCEKCKQIFPELRAEQQIGQAKSDRRSIISGIPPCDDKKEFFTVSHIPISELQNIVPLGNLNPSGHTFPTNHLYFHLKAFTGYQRELSAPAVAPGNISIISIVSSEYMWDEQQIKDYKINFAVCDGVIGYFIHLTSLSEKLLESFGQTQNCNEYDTGGVHYKTCQRDFYSSPISVASGEPIGTVGGSSDFGLADLRTPELVYANPNRWYDEPLHRVCPLDYFTEDVKTQLKFLLGSSDTKRTIEPICGEVAQDKPGTSRGVWFIKGTSNTYPEDPQLALVHDNIDPLKEVFSVGTSINGLQSGAYYFTPENSGLVNRDFNDVKVDGNVYCYETEGRFDGKSSFIIIIQLTTSTTLIIEKQNSNSCGNGPWTFSSNYADFER